MLLSHKHNFIFIHIYKNAGTSITDALSPFATGNSTRLAARVLKSLHMPSSLVTESFPPHIKANEVIQAIGREKYDSFFSFAIVRNPWDWQASLYNYMLMDTTHWQHNLVRSLGTFEKYIRWRCEEEVRFQKDFVYSASGELLVDFIGKFETLDADFARICSRIGISASLPKLNVSNTKPYQQFYRKETRDLVGKTFDADIRLFEYEF